MLTDDLLFIFQSPELFQIMPQSFTHQQIGSPLDEAMRDLPHQNRVELVREFQFILVRAWSYNLRIRKKDAAAWIRTLDLEHEPKTSMRYDALDHSTTTARFNRMNSIIYILFDFFYWVLTKSSQTFGQFYQNNSVIRFVVPFDCRFEIQQDSDSQVSIRPRNENPPKALFTQP